MRDMYDKRDVVQIVGALLLKLGGVAKLSALELERAGDFQLHAEEEIDRAGMKHYVIRVVR